VGRIDPGERVFRQRRVVRFADVDAAGIVYYPRLLDYCHLAFEDFFEHAGARPYSYWIQDERLGFPTVHLDVDFLRPVEYGSSLTVTARVERIGTRSVTFRFEGILGDGGVAFRAEVTKVCVGMDTGRSQEISPELRELFATHLVAETGAESRAEPRA
jgi:4-hydroxybenzoyl-CoA thioesterase